MKADSMNFFATVYGSLYRRLEGSSWPQATDHDALRHMDDLLVAHETVINYWHRISHETLPKWRYDALQRSSCARHTIATQAHADAIRYRSDLLTAKKALLQERLLCDAHMLGDDRIVGALSSVTQSSMPRKIAQKLHMQDTAQSCSHYGLARGDAIRMAEKIAHLDALASMLPASSAKTLYDCKRQPPKIKAQSCPELVAAARVDNKFLIA